MKTWDKPGFSPYFTQGKPGKPGSVPGTNLGLSLGQTRGRRAAQKVYVKKVYVPFSLAKNGVAEKWIGPCQVKATVPLACNYL